MEILLYLFIALISVVLWIRVLTNCVKRRRLLPERSRLRRARWGLMEIFVIGLVYMLLPELLVSTYLDWNPAVQVAINDMQADSDDSVILNPPMSPSSSLADSGTDTDSENAENPENDDSAKTDSEKAGETDSNTDENAKNDDETDKDGSEGTANEENTKNRKPKIYTKEADDEFLKQLLEETKKQEAEQEKAAKEKEQEEKTTESNATEEPLEKKPTEPTATSKTSTDKTAKDSKSKDSQSKNSGTKDSSAEDVNSETSDSSDSKTDDSDGEDSDDKTPDSTKTSPDARETASDEEITEDIGEESSAKSSKKKVEKGAETTPSYAIDNPLEDMQEISVINPLDLAYSASSDAGGSVPVEDPLGERGEDGDSLEDNPNSQSQSGNTVTSKQHELKPHPIIEMLNADPTSFFFLLFYAAMLVPLTEEFIFRLILQGGLEAYERVHFATQWHSRAAQRNSGWRAMVAVALFFAFLHYRPVESVTPTVLEMKINTYGTAIAYVILLVFGVFLLRVSTTATWRDMGLDFSHWLTDLKLGSKAFLLFVLPTYIMQMCLPRLFNNAFVPDPISLIPVATGFGILYWHTRRLLPSVVAHMLLNGSSMLLSLWNL